MKKIFSLILIFICFKTYAQFPQYRLLTNELTRTEVGALQAKKGIINGVFTDTTAANADYIDFYNGAQIYTRSDRNFWLRDSVLNRWIRMAKYGDAGGRFGVSGEDATATQARAFDANYNTFGITKILSGQIKAGTGLNYTDVTFDSTFFSTYISHGASNNYSLEINRLSKYWRLQSRTGSNEAAIAGIDDSLILTATSGKVYIPQVPYHSGENIVHLGLDTLIGSPTFGKLVRKTAGGGSGGTVNSGAANKAAYYPSTGTLIDDVTGVEYNITNLLAKFSTQATTDVGLEIKLASSQTANALNISSSAATGDLAIISAAGASRFTSQKIGTASNTFITLFANGEALFSSDATATLNDPLAFDNTHQIYGGNNSRLVVSAGSGYSHKTSIVTGNGLQSYYGGAEGGFIGQETNQALNFYTNDITRATITAGGEFQIVNALKIGSISQDDTEQKMLVWNSTAKVVEYKILSYQKGLTVETPSASESVGMWKTPVAITVSSLAAVLVGSSSPSVTINIAFGSDRTSGTNVFTSGQTVTSTTTGHTFNSGFNDATIPAGSFIWFTTSAQSGTVTQIEITFNYTED